LESYPSGAILQTSWKLYFDVQKEPIARGACEGNQPQAAALLLEKHAKSRMRELLWWISNTEPEEPEEGEPFWKRLLDA
jgi:hypothetical protein